MNSYEEWQKAKRDLDEAIAFPKRFAIALFFLVFIWNPAVFLIFWAFGWGIFAK